MLQKTREVLHQMNECTCTVPGLQNKTANIFLKTFTFLKVRFQNNFSVCVSCMYTETNLEAFIIVKPLLVRKGNTKHYV